MSSSERLKIFIRRNDIEAAELSPITSKPDRYELDMWEGDIPMPWEEFLTRIKGCSAILCNYPIQIGRTIGKEVLEAAGPQLKVVTAVSSGYEHIDVEAMKISGVRVGHCPRMLDEGVAEHTITLILMALYRVPEHIKSVYDENCRIDHFRKPLYPLGGNCLYGKTVGIVGLGGIGVQVAKRLKGFNLKKLLYTSRRNKPSLSSSLGATFSDFCTLLSESDVIVISCALNESTRGIFGADAFKRMKKTAVLVNVARGAIVNQEDLEQALKNNEIGFAALDVTTPEPLPLDHPLLDLPNCLVTPHMAPSAHEPRSGVFKMAVMNVVNALEGKEMPAEVKS